MNPLLIGRTGAAWYMRSCRNRKKTHSDFCTNEPLRSTSESQNCSWCVTPISYFWRTSIWNSAPAMRWMRFSVCHYTLTAISFSIGPMRLKSEILAPLLWSFCSFLHVRPVHILSAKKNSRPPITTAPAYSANSVFLANGFLTSSCCLPWKFLLYRSFWPCWGWAWEISGSFVYHPAGKFWSGFGGYPDCRIISQASAKGALFAVLSFPFRCHYWSPDPRHRLALDGESGGMFSWPAGFIFIFHCDYTLSLLLFEFIWRNRWV